MTINRNIREDQRKTAEKIQDRSSHQPVEGRNWLGHTKGAACIDEKLLDGSTMDDLFECRGAIQRHLDHLRDEHGLHVTKGSIIRFDIDRSVLGI